MDIMSDISVAKFLFVIALLTAACFDIASYRIPNVIVLLVLLGFVVVSLASPVEVDWFDHVLAGAIFFVGGIVFYALGQMGAGDVKLLGAIALWGGFGALVPLLFWIAVAGLLVLLVLIFLRKAIPLLRSSGLLQIEGPLPPVLVGGNGVPYGVPILIGSLIALSEFPAWLWAF